MTSIDPADHALTEREVDGPEDRERKYKWLLSVAHVYLTRFVSVEEALADGFDIDAWAAEVEQLLAKPRPEPISVNVTPQQHKLCWQGPTYSHPAHPWEEDRPGGRQFWCPGASTDRT